MSFLIGYCLGLVTVFLLATALSVREECKQAFMAAAENAAERKGENP